MASNKNAKIAKPLAGAKSNTYDASVTTNTRPKKVGPRGSGK